MYYNETLCGKVTIPQHESLLRATNTSRLPYTAILNRLVDYVFQADGDELCSILGGLKVHSPDLIHDVCIKTTWGNRRLLQKVGQELALPLDELMNRLLAFACTKYGDSLLAIVTDPLRYQWTGGES
jgi:hypothetical protein